MAGRAKADCGANLVMRSSPYNRARFALVPLRCARTDDCAGADDCHGCEHAHRTSGGISRPTRQLRDGRMVTKSQPKAFSKRAMRVRISMIARERGLSDEEISRAMNCGTAAVVAFAKKQNTALTGWYAGTSRAYCVPSARSSKAPDSEGAGLRTSFDDVIDPVQSQNADEDQVDSHCEAHDPGRDHEEDPCSQGGDRKQWICGIQVHLEFIPDSRRPVRRTVRLPRSTSLRNPAAQAHQRPS